MILSLILTTIASRSNAIMDICADKFSNSIYNSFEYSRRYYDKRHSWRNKYVDRDLTKGRLKWELPFGITMVKHPAFTDQWHKHKSLMLVIIFLLVALQYYEASFVFNVLNISPILYFSLEFILLGVYWNFIFMLYYTRILLQESKRPKNLINRFLNFLVK